MRSQVVRVMSTLLLLQCMAAGTIPRENSTSDAGWEVSSLVPPRPHFRRQPSSLGTFESCDDRWLDGLPFNGVDGYVYALAAGGDGNIYIGGTFTVAGNTSANGIAKWDGTSWSALGTGVNGSVSSIAVSGHDVYVGGGFTVAGGVPVENIAKWNGSTWSSIGFVLEHPVTNIEISDTFVYISGNWYNNAQDRGGYVGRWDGTNWQNLATFNGDNVNDIAVSGPNVYVAGSFTTAGGTPAENIAKWDGSSWTALGAGPNGRVNSIAVSQNDVYVGGSRSSGPDSMGYVAKWNGSTWADLGPGMTNSDSSASLKAICVSGSDIYAIGRFDSIGGTPARGFAKWNGSSWSGGGPDSPPYFQLMAVSGSEIAIMGYLSANYLRLGALPVFTKWNGSSWSTFGMTGQISTVVAMTGSDSEVYAAGYFTTDNGATYSRAAIWNGTGWTPLGVWPGDPEWTDRGVAAIAVRGANVYLGGDWHKSGVFGTYVAKWDGSNWSTLVSSPSLLTYEGNISALAFGPSGTDLYVGGAFAMIDGVPANNIAKWNGSNWSALGSGTNAPVLALTVSGTDLYVGGRFTSAGGVPVNYLAKWGGTSWSSLGYAGPMSSRPAARPEDLSLFIADIEVSGNDLYVGGGNAQGYFDYGSISRWNSSSWTNYPQVLDSAVLTLSISGANIYGAGVSVFSRPSIAKWNGTAWIPLGSGVNGDVYSIIVRGSELFVGGNFTTAGCHVSAYFARYSLPVASVSGRVTSPTGQGLRNVVVSFTDQSGVERTVATGSLGYYFLENIALDTTYTITARSKRYRFSSRTMKIVDNISGLDFIGQE